jgi:hypothetical protein
MTLSDPNQVVEDLLDNNWNSNNVAKPDISQTEDEGRRSTRGDEEVRILRKTTEDREGNLVRQTETINVDVIVQVISRDDKITEYKREISRIVANNKTAVQGLGGGWDEVFPPDADFDEPDYVESMAQLTIELEARSKSQSQLY